MSRNDGSLHDPNAEYTMRELSAETTGVRATRGGGRDVAIHSRPAYPAAPPRWCSRHSPPCPTAA